MEFRRSGDRRRRVLMDERAPQEEVPGDSAGEWNETRPRRAYAESALPQHQPRITDLVPTRWRVLLLWLLTGAAAVAGAAALHHYRPLWQEGAGAVDLSPLDLAAPASLGAWLTSMWLAAAAAASLLVFNVRRHKTDDYRGGYRLWLWTAAVLTLASIDAAAGLHGMLAGLLGQFEAAAGIAPEMWGVVIYAALIGPPAVRMFFELRCSRPATAALLITQAALIVPAVLLALPSLRPAVPHASLIIETLLLAGAFGALFTIVLFTRHVILESQGRLSPPPRPRPSKRREPSPSAQARKSGQKIRVDAAHDDSPAAEKKKNGGETSSRDPHPAEERKQARQPAAATTTAAAGEASADAGSPTDESDRKLSKAERRRLRKQQRRG